MLRDPGPLSVHGLAAILLAATAACSSPLPSFEQQRAADHNRVGSEAFRRGDLETAAAHFERALESARATSDRVAETTAENNLGMVFEARGDDDAALAHFDAALRRAAPGQFGDEGDEHALGAWSASLNRSRLLLRRGDLALAEEAVGVASEAAERIGSLVTRAAVLKQEGLILRAAGRSAEALSRAREALRLYQIGEDTPESRAGRADTHLLIGRLLREGGDPVLAVASFGAAATVAERVPDRALRATAFTSIADTLEQLGHLDDARLRYRMAFDEYRYSGDVGRAEEVARALLRLAEAQHRKDHRKEAEALLAMLSRPPEGD